LKFEKNSLLTFTWWNTSLAPSAKSRASDEDRDSVCEIVKYLATVKEADFIALGEMSELDSEYLIENCNIGDYKFIVGVSKAGKSHFDTLYLYNPSKVFISKVSNITSNRGNKVTRIAQEVTLIINDFDEPFHLLVSHWSSRLWCHENSPARDLLGVRLRDKIDEIISEYETPPFIILLGDYNDDPFADSLNHQVMATRDIELVSKKTHLLYNPFWKCFSSNDSSPGGSYYYKTGDLTKWHTFDQIIFSHAFISAKKWKYSNCFEHIVNIPGYIEKIKDRDSIFDHFPVLGSIKRVI
jgi:hypothetical protein